MTLAISHSRTLHRLIYYSQQAFQAGQNADVEVEAIIASSLRNNKIAQLSGLLLVHDGWFVQALEGPAEQVMSTYQRILNDKRHRAGRVISAGPASERLFPEWSMCARRFDAANDAILDTLSRRTNFSPETLKAPSVLRLLESVREIQFRLSRQA
jgi:hypothetical protein